MKKMNEPGGHALDSSVERSITLRKIKRTQEKKTAKGKYCRNGKFAFGGATKKNPPFGGSFS
jgi:hypothetical protein